jgi:hypothetical protein
MLIKKTVTISSSEITPREVYQQRRRFLCEAGALAVAGVGATLCLRRE